MNALTDKQRFHCVNTFSRQTYDNNHCHRQCRYALHLQTANRLKQPNNNNTHFVRQQHSDRNRQLSEDKSNSMQNDECDSPTLTSRKTALSLKSNIGSYKAEKEKEKENVNTFSFPNIDIKLIDEMQCTKDLFEKVLRTNFGQYFLKLFPKQLEGTLTSDLVETVQKYLQILTENGKLDSPIHTANCPPQYFACTSKRAFLQKIDELQSRKNFRAIEEMIKHYFVPHRSLRQSCLREIFRMLSQSLYEQFNRSKEKEFVLLDQNGSLIEEMCTIQFTTTVLMVSNKQSFESSFAKYKAILQQSRLHFTKVSFTESWNRNFRGVIVSGKCKPSSLRCGNTAHGLSAMTKQTKNKQFTHRSLRESSERLEPHLTVPNSGKDRQSKRSKSSEIDKHLLSLLTNMKTQTIEVKKRYETYEAVFAKLKRQSSITDDALNVANADKLPMSVLKRKFSLFKGKSAEHVDAILSAFQIDPNQTCISKSQFIKINEVAMCKGEHTEIVKFVIQYLPFNEYGELGRENLSEGLTSALKDVSGAELVLNIVWSWLERNGLVESGVLLRNTLQSWYGKYKMAFVVLTSLIFGTHSAPLANIAHSAFV